ncbi:MAG: helix-turn-helix domain-containing protein [Candidatus Aenigmarchaeota archaeon]|nr:helix-turn-helix domain-containing protein [Candidatus Aenigmarchaeota archaeon]
MEKKEIIEMLKRFGLSEYQSKVYSALVFLGPSKVGNICKYSNVPQSRIYNVLEELVEKQFVEVFEGRPKEFRAFSPEVVLRSLVEEKEKELERLKVEASSIKKMLRPVVTEKDIIEGVWTQKGEKSKEVLNRLAEMLESCENYAYDITRDFSYSSALREAIKGCVRRGVKLMTISMSSINEENYYKAKWYNALGLPIRVFETKVHPRILVVDGREVSIRLDGNPLKKSFTFQSIWSEDPSLVKVFDSYMKNLWSRAKPVEFDKIPIAKLKA